MEQPNQNPAGSTGTETPGTIELEIAGEVKNFTKQQLAEGVMRQQDYTKKTQELSTQKQEMDTLRDRYEGFGQFQTLLNNDPGLAQDITNLIENRRANSAPQGQYNQGEFNNESNEYNEGASIPQEELQRINDRLAFVENTQARDTLKDKIGELKRQFPNANVDNVVDYAMKHNLGVNLEDAYMAMSFRDSVKEAKEKGEKAGADKIIKAMSDRDLSDIQTGKGSSPNLQGVQLTSEQRSYARMMKLSDKEYIEGMKNRGARSPEQRAEV